MKRTLLSALVLAGTLFALTASAEESAAELLMKLARPLRLLQLALQEPDVSLHMPVEDVLPETVSNTWQAPRGQGRRHEGQDIFAKRGTPVYSATPGIVLQMDRGGIGGNSVFVFGAGGRAYYYAHLDGFAPGMAPGAEVGTSTLLGYVGNTGNARNVPPHLHFGLYTATTTLDPLPLIIGR